MSHQLKFDIVDPDGFPIQACGRLRYSLAGAVQVESKVTDGSGSIEFTLPEQPSECVLLVQPERTGHWETLFAPAFPGGMVICENIDKDSMPCWSTRVFPEDNLPRGDGVKVGIIDMSFRPAAELNYIKYVDMAPPSSSSSYAAHGETICRLLGDPGVGLRSKLVFVGAGTGNGLDDQFVANAIGHLVHEEKVDVISLSACMLSDNEPLDSVFDAPIVGLRSAIRAAQRFGTICLVAAGNRPGPVAPPGSFDECLAVGCIGSSDWGPKGSYASWWSARATDRGTLQTSSGLTPVYHWPMSAGGVGLNLVAPGVGLIIFDGSEPICDVTGTSFAAPLASAVLAMALSRDTQYINMARGTGRWAAAMKAMQRLCVNLPGIGADVAGWGCPMMP